jgi:hypothetical protein
MTDSIAGFFSGQGKSAKFPTMGTTVEGVITKVHPPEQQTDFDTRLPIPGKYQIRIELDTDLRDPDIDGDDGKRTLYVRGWMQGAIGDALKAAGVAEPEPGAKLAVTWSSSAPPTRPGLQGAHQYTAVYKPSGTFFQTGQPNGNQQPQQRAQPQNAPIPDQPPAGIDPAAWAVMPETARQAIANVAAGLGN